MLESALGTTIRDLGAVATTTRVVETAVAVTLAVGPAAATRVVVAAVIQVAALTLEVVEGAKGKFGMISHSVVQWCCISI